MKTLTGVLAAAAMWGLACSHDADSSGQDVGTRVGAPPDAVVLIPETEPAPDAVVVVPEQTPAPDAVLVVPAQPQPGSATGGAGQAEEDGPPAEANAEDPFSRGDTGAGTGGGGG